MATLKYSQICIVLFWCFIFYISCTHAKSAVKNDQFDHPKEVDIKKYNIEPGNFSVSGISAGGYMSVQFSVAFSEHIKGVGVIAGGPYYCAQESLTIAVDSCMLSPPLIPLSLLQAKVKQYQKKNLIDPISNVAKQKVYLFSGKLDTIVNQGVMKKLEKQYINQFSVPKSQIKTNFHTYAEHAHITNNYGSACWWLGSPFINNCGVDASDQILKHVYDDDLAPPTKQVSSNLHTYKQSGSYSATSFMEKGFIYIPTKCKQGHQCKLHLALAGCNMDYSKIGLDYVKHGGYNEVAEANNIIVVYPQVGASTIAPFNPQGCFDWWSYSGSNYATKHGAQMKAIANVINDLGYTLD